ncbi:DEAD/DEAH box helicase [Anaerophaga thermohalophila]|uniref:DEAD/DEAH box helicase n=1 Tax=Anaerophaga thermohalophila TaxID=177400 RepID=UPI000237CDDF|nr:DEAD/DEAH box helicase [Anaerophaga thermohalophila]
MAKYGQTWWGEEWLKALSHIDYSNRLPRGRAYANKGAVQEIIFNGSTINAKVRGTRPKPYSVTIKVPAFSEEGKRTLLDAIIGNPLLLSKLLNRELPVALNSLAREKGIKIFPQRWDDLEMECSCPDWAVPCKHLAAVINVIANEIDRNPFVVFKIHGFDIIEELKKKGLEAVDERVTIPATDEWKVEAGGDFDEAMINGDVDNIDFSGIRDLREDLFSLLEEKPLFYSSDFKAALDKIYRKTANTVSRLLKDEGSYDQDIPANYEKYDRVRLYVSDGLFFSEARIYENDEVLIIKNVRELVDFLSGIPPKFIKKLEPGLSLLYFSYHYTLKLVEKSAMIPQLVKLSGRGGYAVRWIPAILNDEVKAVTDLITKVFSVPLVIIDGKQSILSPEEQTKSLVSIFARYFIREAGQEQKLMEEPASRIFIDDYFWRFDRLGEKEIPASIQRWLDRFFVSHQVFTPVVQIDEEKKEGLFRLSVLVENNREPLKAPVSLEQVMNDNNYTHTRMEILRSIDLLTGSFSALERIIASSGRESPLFTQDELPEVLFNVLPLIKLSGIKVVLPQSLKKLVRPKATVALLSNEVDSSKSFLKLDEILKFQWKVALGDQFLDPSEFSELVKGLSGIVKLKEQYVYLNQADVKALMDNLRKQESLDRSQMLQAAISGEYNGAKILIDDKTRALIDELFQTREVELPRGLNATMRPYQKRGFDWLFKNIRLGFGSIIADDMGLGKTLQVIAVILKLKREGALSRQRVLVVVPTTLLSNWQKELDKFAPELLYSVYHGTARELNVEADVVISSYGVVRSDIDQLSKIKWQVVVIDEAQNIKNPNAAQTKAVKKLKSAIRLAMSGTPVENRLSEYWSIFDFTNKGYLGSRKKFSENFAKPIEQNRDKAKLKYFLKITGPFILRRMKTDKSIIDDLPEKVENDFFASLTKEQAAIYQNVLDNIMREISGVDVNEEDGKIQRKGLVLKLIMALKQICNHPSQYLKKNDYSPDLSGKAGVFLNLVNNIIENDDKVLVFTQFREMGVILQHLIKETFDMNAMFLHGGTTRKQRDEMVEKFQNNPHEKVFILSIKAAGTGLNLTAANHVIHYDLWWNPAVESQATDRAFRIGQHKNVMVYRLITQGTFEEKINKMLTNKKELANLTVASGEKWVGDLSDNELKELFTLSE